MGRYPNVVSSLQYERLLSASGPTKGHVQRPSDGSSPKRIAFLQCVGSRDQYHDYCSSVCCMYAAKEAIMTVEHARAEARSDNGDGEVTCQIFFMDTRAYSKGYEEYYRRAERKYGVEYTRCRISDVKEDPVSNDLVIRYMDSDHGSLITARFDLVVLSVGMEISESVKALGRSLRIKLDQYGFCHTTLFEPVQTSRPGIYVAGPFREPKDIPETIEEASGAAAVAAELLAPARHTLAQARDYPSERDVSAEQERIGVFACHCGSNIGGFLDVPGVADYARSLPGVVHAEDNMYRCSQDTVAHIIEQTKALALNRVVGASCTPLTHGTLFQDAIRQAGLNPYLFEMANIRNQCSWVHSHDWDRATGKAKDLVRMSTARAAALEPLGTSEMAVEKAALVIGGGPAGIAAAHDLSILGHNVTIYEREARAGGMLRYGIPEFRLPREVLDIEVQNATRMGVTLQTGVTVGCNEGDIPLSKLLDRFDAVLLATGCMAAMPLPLRDRNTDQDLVAQLPNAEYGLDFLLDLHRGKPKTVGQRVAVVGAGFTALDCARVARRLGAETVSIHIRTSENYIPVMDEEILEAKREGIPIRGLRTPVALQIDDNGVGTGICFVQNRLGGWRASGRRPGIPIPGSEFTEPFDTLLVAIGQRTVNDYLDVPVELDRWGSVRVGEDGMTSVQGLFATGDFVNGSSTVIEAIGHGRATAGKLDSWLMQWVRQRKVVRIEPVDKPVRERQFDFIERQSVPTATVVDRFKGLTTEVEQGLDTDHSLEEAKRCYLCYLKYEIDVDNCIYCRACIEVAPRDCIKLVEGVEINDDGTYGELQETNVWRDTAAIWIDNDECIRCGACYKVCPTRCISISKNEIITQSV